jgi:hypothetical protein
LLAPEVAATARRALIAVVAEGTGARLRGEVRRRIGDAAVFPS